MTREEEILNAAREYNNGITLSSPSNVLHFEAGAKWSDEHPDLSSLWHKASEEPQGYNCSILCQDTEGNCWVENMFVVLPHNTWDEYIKIEMVDKWAYIEDFIPKNK